MLTDNTPSEAKTLLELKAKKPTKPAAAPETLHDRVTAAFNNGQEAGATDSNNQRGEGAAEAVGVLTAVDEDGEGAEEAEVPREFEYHSDEHDDE